MPAHWSSQRNSDDSTSYYNNLSNSNFNSKRGAFKKEFMEIVHHGIVPSIIDGKVVPKINLSMEKKSADPPLKEFLSHQILFYENLNYLIL